MSETDKQETIRLLLGQVRKAEAERDAALAEAALKRQSRCTAKFKQMGWGVKVTDATHPAFLVGETTCRTCGRVGVEVRRMLDPATGRPTSAWRYEEHDKSSEECPGRGCLIYLCPQSGESECTQHGGFDVCCDDPACPSRLLDRLAAAEAEVERLTLTDTELCQCPEGPYFGAQMAPSIPRCERCRRPSDPRVMALLAEVERLHRLVGEQTTKARDAITERDDLRRRHSHLQQRVLAVAMPEQILAILDAPQTDGGGAHDRRPEPGDGPEYAADLAAWLERNGGDGR